MSRVRGTNPDNQVTTDHIERVCEILQHTPGVLRAWLEDLPDRWVLTNYGPDSFSPFDVVGHLIHGEKTDWMARVRHILAHGDTTPFESFDRYAMFEASAGKSIGDLLNEFKSLRLANLAELRALNLTDPDMSRPGLHPELGGVTLGQLLATWATHDLHHLAQIGKCMARQFKGEVGVWERYLGILDSAK